jgi:hypothetical protein
MAGNRSGQSAKPRDFRGLGNYSDLASQSSPPRGRGLRKFHLTASCHLAVASFCVLAVRKGAGPRETISPVSPFGVQGLGLESEPNPYYGLAGRVGKCPGALASKGTQESLNECVVRIRGRSSLFWRSRKAGVAACLSPRRRETA